MTATASTPLRKSRRLRAPNKKYTDDPFEGLGILSSDSEDNSAKSRLQNEANNDDDFPANRAVQESEAEVSDDNVGSNVSDGSAVLTPEENNEDPPSYASSDADNEPETRPTPRSKVKGNYGPQAKPTKRPSRIDLLGGTREQDVLHILTSRNQWVNDPTLPSRNRMCYLFSHTENLRHTEATIGWDWYYDQGGLYSFGQTQKTRALSIDEGSLYVPGCTEKGHDFLMGPYGNQKLFTLSALHTSGLEEAWTDATNDDEPATQQGSRKRKRHGWMLNVGSRVKCLDWAPNHDGDTQYLALATGQTKRPLSTDPPGEAPAFTPAVATPSCIQIWAFATSPATDLETSPDSDRSPLLEKVLCSDWGDVKQLKWCPMPRIGRDEDDRGKVSIGLLAGVWSDGYARVLDVQFDKAGKGSTAYVKLESAAFATRPSNAICTCLAWLSPTDLAVGHSNGYLAIYDIYPQDPPQTQVNHTPQSSTVSTSMRNPPTSTSPANIIPPIQPPPPPLHANPHTTLPLQPHPLLTLTTAYPTHPTFLCLSSLSGYTSLLSLLNPITRPLPRTRSPASSLVYHPALLSFISADDSSETIRLHPLMAWGQSLAYAKTSGGGVGRGCLDVGRVHSSVAWGAADGGVWVGNPMRKVLGRKEVGWLQLVFRQEWVRGARGDDGEGGEGKREGMSRITEGYAAEKVDLGPGKRGMTAVFEEETGCTAVGWNPNLSAGGWLAVGWGSGLVRVEDVAVD